MLFIDIISVNQYLVILIVLISIAICIIETDGNILPFLFHGTYLYHLLDTTLDWKEGDTSRKIILDFSIKRSVIDTYKKDKLEILTLGSISGGTLITSMTGTSLIILSQIFSIMGLSPNSL